MENISKIDHKTLHFLPVLPTVRREKGFTMEREWGKYKMEITAYETLNTYDLFTLLFMVEEYIVNGYEAGSIGEGKNKREIAGIDIDLKRMLSLRGVGTNKHNRETLIKSFRRLKSVELMFTNKEEKKKICTTYIYEYIVDDNIENITVYANKSFIHHIIESGVSIDLHRLKKYPKRESFSVLLDLYLQGNKKVFYKGKSKKKYYKYKDYYSFEEIERVLKLDLTNNRKSKKISVIQDAFNTLHNVNKLPLYIYNKNRNMFYKQKENN